MLYQFSIKLDTMEIEECKVPYEDDGGGDAVEFNEDDWGCLTSETFLSMDHARELVYQKAFELRQKFTQVMKAVGK
jgi:hypothetical protein